MSGLRTRSSEDQGPRSAENLVPAVLQTLLDLFYSILLKQFAEFILPQSAFNFSKILALGLARLSHHTCWLFKFMLCSSLKNSTKTLNRNLALPKRKPSQ